MPIGPLIAGVKVRAAGTDLLVDDLQEVRVEQHLFLPDTCSFRLADPTLKYVDEQRFAPGADVEISFAGPEQTAMSALFVGKIAAVEPEFGHGRAVLTVRGYDLSHALHRSTKTRAFQQMAYSEIVRKVAQEAGLRVRQIKPTGEPVDFVQQSNETDWSFLWRLAGEVDFVIAMEGSALDFRPAGDASPSPPVALVWNEGLVQLRPRVTGVQQADKVTVNGWDPKSKRSIVASAPLTQVDGQIGLSRAAASSALRGGEVTVADRSVPTNARAQALAKSTAARLGNAYLEAEGVALGDPHIKAGARVTIDGVGRRFGGTYLVSSVQHVYRGSQGYESRFTVSGRSTRTLLDLMAPSPRRPWGEGLVVGVVSNNKDPEAMGRVRVKYPALGQELESGWARIVAPAAGAGRGMLMMPLVDDEVVVGFEHGDPQRPYVLGAVFNGRQKPGALAHPDGSLHVHSDKEILLESTGKMTVDSGQDLAVTVKGKKTEQVTGQSTIKSNAKMEVQAGGPLAIEGQGPTTIKSSAPMTVESNAALTVKAGGSLSIQCSGVLRLSGAQIMLG